MEWSQLILEFQTTLKITLSDMNWTIFSDFVFLWEKICIYVKRTFILCMCPNMILVFIHSDNNNATLSFHPSNVFGDCQWNNSCHMLSLTHHYHLISLTELYSSWQYSTFWIYWELFAQKSKGKTSHFVWNIFLCDPKTLLF